MKVKEIHIEGYKGFKSADIQFNDQLNVFVGENGAGKSTILTAIIKCLVRYTSEFAPLDELGGEKLIGFSKNEVNHKASYLSLLLLTDPYIGRNKYIDLLPAPLGTPARLGKKGENYSSDLFKFQEEYFQKQLKADKTRLSILTESIPIIKYYPAKEVNFSQESKPNKHIYLTSQLEAWSNIYPEHFSIARFTSWFYDQENYEFREQLEHEDKWENPRIAGIRKAVHDLYYRITGKHYRLSVKLLDAQGRNEKIASFVLKNTENAADSLLISDMSDGQLRIFMFVADIAYNLSIANNFDTENDFLAGAGVVLIDEIETHLHPKWQREVIPLLMNLFPNIQFFITTHSPQVISSVSSDSLILCDDFKTSKVNIRTKGIDSNMLLKRIFGASERPVKYIELLNKLTEAIDTEQSEEVLQAIYQEAEELVNQQQDNGEDFDTYLEELQDLINASLYFND